MQVIKAGTRKHGNVKGADCGASISLILDESDPGQGPRLHRHPLRRDLGRARWRPEMSSRSRLVQCAGR